MKVRITSPPFPSFPNPKPCLISLFHLTIFLPEHSFLTKQSYLALTEESMDKPLLPCCWWHVGFLVLLQPGPPFFSVTIGASFSLAATWVLIVIKCMHQSSTKTPITANCWHLLPWLPPAVNTVMYPLRVLQSWETFTSRVRFRESSNSFCRGCCYLPRCIHPWIQTHFDQLETSGSISSIYWLCCTFFFFSISHSLSLGKRAVTNNGVLN